MIRSEGAFGDRQASLPERSCPREIAEILHRHRERPQRLG